MKKGKKNYIVRIDYNIIAGVILLVTFGAVILFTSSSGDVKAFKEHLIFMTGGFAGMLVMSFLDYKWLKKIPWPVYYVAAVASILLLLTPLKVVSHGAARWIDVGFSIQISEVVKLCMIIFLAYVISEYLLVLTSTLGVWIVWGSVGIIGAMILLISKNLSSCLILLMVTFCMTYIASNLRRMHIITLISVIVFVVLFCWFLSEHLPTEEQLKEIEQITHQFTRIFAWLSPESYPDDSFQTTQGLYAIGSGGFFGQGLGSSMQRGILPEASNDMIFCILIEELGVFGGLMLLLLYIYFFYQILLVTINAKTRFGKYLCAGSLFFFAFQVMVNIAVVTAVIPNTGVTLPFMSSGGSALIIGYAQIGLVLSVYRYDVLKRS